MLQLVCRDAIPTGQLVELLASHDPVVKQLTADYVAYAHCSSGRDDLGLLVTNLLSRDCNDANPLVSGSAVTALASLRTAQDTALSAILHTLNSQHQKVRRCASAACLSYATIHPESAASSGLTDCLYDRLRDADPIVVANSLLALDHILRHEGGVVINRPIAHYLFSRLQQFSMSSLETVLVFMKKYAPKDDADRFQLLNTLDECFKTDDAVVLVAAVELFLHWTSSHPNLRLELMKVMQPSFCRIFLSSSPETCYLLVEFLISLGGCIRDVFNPHYRYFNLNPNDPTYLKEKKLEMFGLIALPANILTFISEIRPYCSDFNSYDQAIKCLSVLGQVSDAGREKVYSILPELLEEPSDKIIAASLECLLNLTACQSQVTHSAVNKSTANVLSELGSLSLNDDSMKTNQEEQAIITCLYISLPPHLQLSLSKVLLSSVFLDKHPELVLHVLSSLSLDCSVACLEQLQARQSNLETSIECFLLATAMRVFLRHPAQSYGVLVRALASGHASQNRDVKSKTCQLYAMVQLGPNEAAKLLLGQK
uniref:AP-4 complex subunit beta-1-like n=1 Tax=Hirondellea gigas TaxID=1518452 RepID=A0A2P2I586_9CRUS